MGKSYWLVAVASLVTAVAQADEQGKVYIAPFVGSTHLRIDAGRVYGESDTIRFDSLALGVAAGFRAPFGLIVEVGHSSSTHANIFDDHGDYELTEGYGSVGWAFPLSDVWRLTPRVGRGNWDLSSNHRVLLDGAGERHRTVSGWANFWGVSLSRDLNSVISMGIDFKDVDEEFGHARSGTFMVSFRF